MSKNRIFKAKDFHKKYFVCGEKICFADCEVCLQLSGVSH
jgi:hypothetical protein